MAHKIIIAGGTGFLGHSLIRYLQQKEDISIIVLTRSKAYVKDNVSFIQWDGATVGKWADQLENSTAVINLAGKSVNCRYTQSNKNSIISSRINATLTIGKASQQCINPPKVWINAGSAAIFGDGRDEIKDELSQPGNGFSAEVCKLWEQAFNSVHTPYTRKVFFRIGLVFQKNTGLLLPFTRLVNAGLGGKIGSGKQYISWIHEDDFVRVIWAALTDENYKGLIHCTSPYPITNSHFMNSIKNVLAKKIALPNPTLLVKIGALLIGTEAELVITGRRVIPGWLQKEKFNFQYPHIEAALTNLLHKE